MLRDVLIEIGLEELPFVAMKQLLEEMPKAFCKWLDEQSVQRESSSIWVTPRRIVFYISHVEPMQKILPSKVKGPPVSVAFKDGKETRALQGFLQKCGTDQYEIETIQNQQYIFCTMQPSCKTIQQVLIEDFPTWIQKFPFKTQMKCTGYQFVRPLRWICCMVGDAVVPLTLFSVQSEAKSSGLRGFPVIPIDSAESYQERLERNFIQLDTVKRYETIQKAVSAYSPESIIEKNAYCTEWPVVCKASFSSSLLKVPKEAIQTMIEDHLICFTLQEANGALSPFFQFVMNGPRDENKVSQGYEKVIAAKLEDAKFFFEQDQKIPLKDRSIHIDRMIFMKGLGTVLQKKDRLVFMVEKFPCGADMPLLKRAAILSKMDLSTHMVAELPELQGTMGRIYGTLQGEEERVSMALESYYSPKRESDPIPRDDIGQILGLLDRIDTLAGAFAIGMSVSSSADPFGLRRQMNGILRILYEKPLSISIKEAFSWALHCYQEVNHLEMKEDEIQSNLQDFYTQRLNLFLQSMHRYDMVNAVLCSAWIHPFCAKEKLLLLEENASSDEFKILCESFTRIRNITKGDYATEDVQTSLLVEPQEIALYEAFQKCTLKGDTADKSDHLVIQLKKMYSLNPFIVDFFDCVLVRCEDPALQENRIRLISAINRYFLQFCDFSEIVFQGGN
jgi:glycyl-tRNA synthetase beta chain